MTSVVALKPLYNEPTSHVSPLQACVHLTKPHLGPTRCRPQQRGTSRSPRFSTSALAQPRRTLHRRQQAGVRPPIPLPLPIQLICGAGIAHALRPLHHCRYFTRPYQRCRTRSNTQMPTCCIHELLCLHLPALQCTSNATECQWWSMGRGGARWVLLRKELKQMVLVCSHISIHVAMPNPHAWGAPNNRAGRMQSTSHRMLACKGPRRRATNRLQRIQCCSMPQHNDRCIRQLSGRLCKVCQSQVRPLHTASGRWAAAPGATRTASRQETQYPQSSPPCTREPTTGPPFSGY